MQPLFCSTAAPYGIHLSIRDNMCVRCGWTAPRPPGAASLSISDNGVRAAGAFDSEEDGGRAA